MPAPPDPALEIRTAAPGDRAEVLELLSASLGWLPDAQLEDFFAWKHEQNPFGRSPGWVAVDGDRIVGYRTFLRWEYRQGGDPAAIRAVRAVDTATHPDYQGRGIFRRLTMAALDDLRDEGVRFVFNTPNSQSRPGYLKMGWTQVGRLPASVRPTSIGSLVRMASSRVPADRWSTATDAGRSALDALAEPALAELLESVAPDPELHTNRSVEYLRWRYGFGPLAYRIVTLGGSIAEGLAVFRLRRRGPALECALTDVLVPAGDRAATRALLRAVVKVSGADYVIRIGGPPVGPGGFVRLPRQGPILTWRGLGDSRTGAALPDWRLTLGDVELF